VEWLGAVTHGGEADAAWSRASVVGAVDSVVAWLGVGFNDVEMLLAWTWMRWCTCVARLRHRGLARMALGGDAAWRGAAASSGGAVADGAWRVGH
jgi:hypothetical protein